jgi:hypothetical protein
MIRTYYVEPTTVVAVAQAAYKLWSASQEARNQKEILSLLRQINTKLDIIIRNQYQILAELKSMKIQFRIDLRNEFIKSLEVDLFAYQSEVNVEVGRLDSSSSRDSLARIAALAQPLRLLSFRFLGYGLPAFTGAIGSALLLSSVYALMRSLGANRRKVDAEELSYLNEWDARLREWLKPESADGITAAINATARQRQEIEIYATNHAKRIFLEWFDTGEEYYTHNRTCKVGQERFLVITGDLQNGFSDSYESGQTNPKWRCEFDYPPDPPGDRRHRHGPAVGAVATFQPSFKSTARETPEYDPEDPFVIPDETEAFELPVLKQSYYANAGFIVYGSLDRAVPVNHPVTQALSLKREEWIGLIESESNLMSLQKVMVSITDRIRGRSSAIS